MSLCPYGLQATQTVPDGLGRGDVPEPPQVRLHQSALWPHNPHQQLEGSSLATLGPAGPGPSLMLSGPACAGRHTHPRPHPCLVPRDACPPACLRTPPSPTHLKQAAGPAREGLLPRPGPRRGGVRPAVRPSPTSPRPPPTAHCPVRRAEWGGHRARSSLTSRTWSLLVHD